MIKYWYLGLPMDSIHVDTGENTYKILLVYSPFILIHSKPYFTNIWILVLV